MARSVEKSSKSMSIIYESYKELISLGLVCEKSPFVADVVSIGDLILPFLMDLRQFKVTKQPKTPLDLRTGIACPHFLSIREIMKHR